jgi:hypothetical protein
MTSYNLFLDDLRNPEHAYIFPKRDGCGIIIPSQSLNEKSGIGNNDWVVVRDYTSFIQTLILLGLPAAVSFDHDLHEEHTKHYYNVTQSTGIIEYGNLKHKTGKHCAEAFVKKWQESKTKVLPRVFIHSANQYGAAEIEQVLCKYFKIE